VQQGSLSAQLVTERSSGGAPRHTPLRHTLRVPETPLTQRVKQWTGWWVQPAGQTNAMMEPSTSNKPATDAAALQHALMQVVVLVKLGGY
jgi:hypothetical protein